MAAAAMKGLSEHVELQEEFFRIWRNWMDWAVRYPEKWKALAQLSVSDEITPTTREAGHKTMVAIAELLERLRASGRCATSQALLLGHS
jgi:hypothetical protein